MTENEAIEVLEERYLTMSMCGDIGQCKRNNQAISSAITALKEIQRYRAIGTVEEFREARERQRGKKPVYRSIFTDGTRLPGCPTCFSRVDGGAFYCSSCGQKLDWSDTP